MTKPGRCEACGGERVSKAFDADEPGFCVARCRDCGLGRTCPDVPDSDILAYYPQTYYGRGNVRFNRLFEAMTRLFQRRRARVLVRLVAPGPVLDVGCGRGFLLKYLQGLGYEPHGVELSDLAAAHARQRLGLDVQTDDFLQSRHEAGRLRAVVFWHTLEHFRRPQAALARARELLAPGGFVAVAVPNSESLQARLFGRHWFHLDVPRHYFHFGTRSLRSLLEAEGFRVVKLDHFCFEQNPYGWLQSFYNALGFTPNLLYALLKNESARTMRLRRHPVQLALTALLLPVLLPASLALTLLEATLRAGGTIEAYAVKAGGASGNR